jgi:16S rRNA (cytosine1402-N4)-methyltransferase
MGEWRHVPVLLDEVVRLLGEGGGLVVDATVGLGGHAEALLAAGIDYLVGLDRDEEALAVARERLERFGTRCELHHARFAELEAVLAGRRARGVLADLGVSSLQLDRPDRGFSFQRPGPLDMRMDRAAALDAAAIVARSPQDQLEAILRAGDVPGGLARRYARVLKELGLAPTTHELAAAIEAATPRAARHRAHHPATLVFQALRIAVNDELGELIAFLPAAFRTLEVGGLLCVLSYHSLEDRLVKRFLALAERGGAPASTPAGSWEPALQRSPRAAVRPSPEEVARNPRARSARLRVARKLRDVDLASSWRQEVGRDT